MALLSSCVFEWDQDDYGNLMTAKNEELVGAAVNNPSDATVKKAVSKEEIAHHCRRKTHSTSDTTDLIKALLLAMLSPATDSLGVKLFSDAMQEIWMEQKHHVVCLHDTLRACSK